MIFVDQIRAEYGVIKLDTEFVIDGLVDTFFQECMGVSGGLLVEEQHSRTLSIALLV